MKRLLISTFAMMALALGAGTSRGIFLAEHRMGLELREATDINPDPHIVEVTLEAAIARVEYAPGRFVDAWTYNGDIPGPLIRVKVGDRLVVHFKNNLPMPSTVHWHGLRVPIQMDGVPGVSQPEVLTGGTFTYDFVVPDAGLYWYHPHVMSSRQVGFGLYGAVLVEDPAENLGIREDVLVLSDIGVEDHGALMNPEDAGGAGVVFGLEGNHVLINGRERPKLTMRSGETRRWRIVNAAKSRYFELEFPGSKGNDTPFTVIGRDGGLQEYPTRHETLLVTPGERVDVLVTPTGKPGSEITIRSLPHNRGYGSEYLSIEDLFTISFTDAPPVDAAPLPRVEREISPLDATGASPVKIDISLVQLDERTVEYRINDIPPSKMMPVKARTGETQIWTVTNETKWSHPMHLHGFFFQVLDKDGKPARPLAWRDTVEVPFEETVQFLVRYDDRPGAWMFHCHILDHAEGGLMGMVEVGTVDGAPATHHTH